MPAQQNIQRATEPEIVQEYNLSPPLRGLLEGLDPALMDSLYLPLFAPDLENFRVVGGRWETRLGQVLFKTLPGSGSVRLLDNLYQSTAIGVNALLLVATSSQYLENTGSGALFTGQDLTVAAWVFANTLATERTIACEFDVSASGTFGYTLNFDPGGKFSFKVAKSDFSGTLTQITSSLAPTTGNWYFVVGRHDAVNHVLSISVNGAASQTTAYTGGVAEPAAVPFRIGALAPGVGSLYWDGKIEMVGVWRTAPGNGGALTDTQIAALYNNGAPIPFSGLSTAQKVGLAAFWNLPEASGTRVDNSGGGFGLTPKPNATPPGNAAGLGTGLAQTTRLAARGTGAAAQFYEYKEESDTQFVTVGSASLGGATQPYFQGVTIGDAYVFTDRAGALRKYTRAAATPGAIATVTNGTAPATAPGVKSRWFDRLEDWSGNGAASPYGWTVSGAADFNFAALNSTDPQTPGGGNTVNVKVIQSSGSNPGRTISNNVTGTKVPSHTIAFWINQHFAKSTVTYGIGINQADEFTVPLLGTAGDNWYPVFFPIGDIGTINYQQFKCVSTAVTGSMWVSALYLPGRLEGSYRWVYTYYNATTGIESAPSPISNGGVASDFSTIGTTNDVTTARAFQKSAVLTFTAAGSPQKIRVYRSGGVPELTKDSRGFDVWYRVAEVFDLSTTITNNPAAGTQTLTMAATANLSAGDCLILEKGVAAKEESVVVKSVDSSTQITVKGQNTQGPSSANDPGLIYAHTAGATLQVAYLDNTPNELIDTTTPLDIRRDDPPQGALFVQRSPEGRLWIFGYKDNPTGVAVSNRATPDRLVDYLTFPDGVDPLTRRSITQGWRFKIGGDNTDETIVWGGFFQGLAHVLTKRHMYVIEAQSQTDWGPIAVQKILNEGCIAGDTVVEINGELMWVADGPRLLKWAGRGRPAEVVSHLVANERLQAAPSANWNQWFARFHTKQKGKYYVFYFVPQGQTTCTQRLDINTDAQDPNSGQQISVWEPVVYYDASGNPIPLAAAAVRDGGGDNRDLYQVDTAGNIWQTENGNTDGGVPIKVRAQTKRYPLAIHSRFPSGALGDVAPGATRHILLGQVAMLMQLFVRGAGVAADTLTVTVTTGGSEYGQVSHAYTLDLSGTGDKETKIRLHRDLYGRWAQVRFDGNFSNRPAIREMVLLALPIRSGAIRT